jgi:integrase
LTPHRNGQWCKKVKGELYYFGKWHDDLKGERALEDWQARKDDIFAGLDKLRADSPVAEGMTLDDLAIRFLKDRRQAMVAGDLSKQTYKDYLRIVTDFITVTGGNGVVAALAPQHFAAYSATLTQRKLGRHSRKRIIAGVKAFLNFGAENGLNPRPTYGTGFKTLDTSPEAIRQEKARAGEKDYSDRILTGTEIDKLLNASRPLFKGIILMGVNAALGPADIGRLKWSHINMETGEIDYPRGKTGVARRAYLWKRTRKALDRVKTLKHNATAIKKHGKDAFVFVTRKGLPMYRESEIVKGGESVGVKIENAVSITFNRVAKTLELEGVTFYRLRHTAKTLAMASPDGPAVNLLMGHKEKGMGRVYDHSHVSLKRLKKVALAIKYGLWGKPKKRKAKTDAKPQVKPGQLRLAS